jgi:gluconate 2-dehydrogenase alpha chain
VVQSLVPDQYSWLKLRPPHQIARAVGARVVGSAQPRRGNFDGRAGQTTHNTGGTIMGADPKTSAVNRYLQAWDADNLFAMGASVFPQNGGYNPTGTVGALAYWSARAIIQDYLKSPGPLVRA